MSVRADRGRALGVVRYAVLAFFGVVAVCIVLAPLPGPPQVLVGFHYLGLALLFLFLTWGEICFFRIVWYHRAHRGSVKVSQTAGWWRIATEFLPAAAALLILSSGLRLVLSGGHSLRSPWLFVLVSGFGLLFSDGIFGYTQDVRNLHRLAQDAASGESSQHFSELLGDPSFNAMRLLHYVSLPILFLVGYWKVPRSLPLLQEGVAAVERVLFPLTGRMTGVVTALALIAFETVVVGILRSRGRR